MLMMVAYYKGKEIVKEPINIRDFDKLAEFHDRTKIEKGIDMDIGYPKYYTQFVDSQLDNKTA